MTMATDPQLLLLDEPTAGLSQELAHKVARQVDLYCRTRQAGALVSTHAEAFPPAWSVVELTVGANLDGAESSPKRHGKEMR